LSLSVSHHLVELYVDCDKVGSAFIPSLGSINSTGHILSGRRADGEIVMVGKNSYTFLYTVFSIC